MTVHVKTQVLPGNRIEVTAADLKVGQDVEVTIQPIQSNSKSTGGILDFIDSLPPGTKTAEEWEAFEREFQQERNSWDH
ncbi:MAG TPA: hypothetical protein VKK61_12230 [Tepidisphaeraceae bacterium]|nr:hypothetical protein [Tepidisphaeraceae bacterium]